MTLVFGKTGQVATELARQAEVTAMGRAELDLMQPGRAIEAIASLRPRLVINASAYTAVDKAEGDAPAAMRLNAGAVGEMARACADQRIPFCHVSTDYVFDGGGTAPWAEHDQTGPLGVYGASKAAGEEAVRAAGGTHLILRTSWVFSAHGSNFVKTMLRLSETRDALSIVSDQIGGPTPAADIAATLLRIGTALQDGTPGGTCHYAGTPALSWADFARAIFAAAGKSVKVTDISSSDYPTVAARPLNSRLDCSAIEAAFGISQPDWQTGLAQVLRELPDVSTRLSR